uniref:NADH dehydrogenase subunit 2 n=1 Tax=Ornithodoros noorsveldensis TaxID=1580573 RepID=UPI0007393336|nr:NADH dehydrogenase subunit 2 [Ornithodoros noorsveldensis]AIZ58698.1 NADH dehydrogenase subunit 2 [Ornithodoros noorsveldensis]AIZ58711.1 NADH dehydrogenase subunit 2 [Ornithodoros noorsveldensis]UYB78483.1 NADH dehydrogenase subunit 2 [Ornithodoros noorsveldensis]
MKVYNLSLIWFITITVTMALSSSSMFLIWLSMEMNMMSFIPLISSKKNMISINSTVMYFIPQAFASAVFIFISTVITMNYKFYSILNPIIILLMILKIGAAPFHIWFPQASEGMSYLGFFLLMTIQKIIPLHLMSMIKSNTILIPIVLSAAIGSIGGLNQFTIRKILAYSSISHLAWIMSLIMFSSTSWMIYLIIYSIIMYFIIQLNKQTNINLFSQINLFSINNSFYFLISMLTLGGLPPMMGFFIKWMTLKIMVSNMILMTIPLILSSLINLYFYTRLLYPMFLKLQTSNKWTWKNNNKAMYYILINLMSIFLMIPLL